MIRFMTIVTGRIAAALAISALTASISFAAAALPGPAVDTPLSPKKSVETAVLAGGCFWGVEAVFKHVKGVTQVTSGYSGGTAESARYEIVSSGATGHAEAVRVSYDPSQVTYGRLLRVFFSVAHNPTELNRQGPDVGTQYRSAIFFSSDEQKKVAQAYIAQLNTSKAFPRPIATEVVALKTFYEAEAYHQDYVARNPTQPYIVIHDLPKVSNLQRQFPELYVRN